MGALLSTILLLAASGPAFREKLNSRNDFDGLARVYRNGDLASLPHVLLVLDRAPGGRLYFVDSNRYAMHQDFVLGQYLSLERGRALFLHTYVDPARRFVFATLVWHESIKRFAIELWEGDQATPAIACELLSRVGGAFFTPLAFKPNSTAQKKLAEQLEGVEVITANALWEARDEIVFNRASAVGTLRFIARMTEEVVLRPGDVTVFGESPVTLSPVAGVVTTSYSTPLAHVNVLAHGWGIPNAFVRGAAEKWKALEGKPVLLDTRGGKVELRAATSAELSAAQQRQLISGPRVPAADELTSSLASLAEQRATDVVRYGAKSANLGEVVHAVSEKKISGISVPPGFGVPFAFFAVFVKENGLGKEIDAFLDYAPTLDVATRRAGLAKLRALFAAGKVNEVITQAILARRHQLLGEAGVFVRSSTNAEDLEGFSGAGLYTTVPNVLTDAALIEAVKTVWGSVWNDAAWEARERDGVDHRAVRAGVLIQRGVDADAAGVLITANLFDTAARDAVYVNAKRGLGIRVVEGRKVPEQLLYDVKRKSVRLLTRSSDDTMLSFAADGGVREVAVEPDRAVLTDARVRRLCAAATKIRAVFGGRAQDIKWLVQGDQVVIVQARPWADPR